MSRDFRIRIEQETWMDEEQIRLMLGAAKVSESEIDRLMALPDKELEWELLAQKGVPSALRLTVALAGGGVREKYQIGIENEPDDEELDPEAVAQAAQEAREKAGGWEGSVQQQALQQPATSTDPESGNPT